jgi:hypothetical protein
VIEMAREPKVNWFVTESADHPYGDTGEKTFTTGAEARAFAEALKQRPDVVHVQWEDHRPGQALSLPKGDLLEQGWVRDDQDGTWRERYREEAGVGFVVVD